MKKYEEMTIKELMMILPKLTYKTSKKIKFNNQILEKNITSMLSKEELNKLYSRIIIRNNRLLDRNHMLIRLHDTLLSFCNHFNVNSGSLRLQQDIRARIISKSGDEKTQKQESDKEANENSILDIIFSKSIEDLEKILEKNIRAENYEVCNEIKSLIEFKKQNKL